MIIDNVTITLVGFLGIVFFLMFFIAKFKWHVFFAMLLPIMAFALLPEVNIDKFINAFEAGFGGTLESIAVVIVLGSIMAEALKYTGAIQVITKSMINLVGRKRMPLALTFSGFVLGIAVFSDVAYVILNPLIHSAAATMGESMATMSTGLVGALQITHAIVPPTPGPIAAAALIGADIGKVIIWGSVCGLFGSIASWAWGQYVVGPRLDAPPSEEFIGTTFLDEEAATTEEDIKLPSTLRSYLPIIVPIVLIAVQSVIDLFLPGDGMVKTIMKFLGWPVVALAIGVGLSYINITSKSHKESAKNEWVEEGLRTSAMIIIVTGMGGSLSEILKGTPAVDAIVNWVASTGMPAILLPFIIGIIGNMITGSTTVGCITAASLVAPMLSKLGLSPEAAMLAGASGSIIIKYVNSSYFWVCTSLSKMKLKEALLSYGGATLVGGIVCFVATWILWGIGII
ncbi:GntP family permease [Schnuerera sp. xch1]|uniref:GntP family permease n=1 Tax=Schnuerera sp. xch1 TaxID=2874283 RepID=UPI001CBDABEA|nr:GntP family permease [Schnuerera sp. xch1]MBZ2174124.1 GntP family permease [Schnuerera sp. xch1]